MVAVLEAHRLLQRVPYRHQVAAIVVLVARENDSLLRVLGVRPLDTLDLPVPVMMNRKNAAA